ncbi:hypothetical protein ACHAWF_012323, partial [Thalassiosira exigua]
MPPRPLLGPRGGEDRRGIPRERLEVVLGRIGEVDRARDAHFPLRAVVALARAVTGPVSHEDARVRPVVNLSFPSSVILHDELGTRVGGGADSHEEVERPAVDVVPVGVDEAAFAVRHGDESEAVDVEGVQVVRFADPLQDGVEPPPGQGPQRVLVRHLVGGVEPVHVALPLLLRTLDVPSDVARVLGLRPELLLIGGSEVEPPRSAGREGVVVQHVLHDVVEAQAPGVLDQGGDQPRGQPHPGGVVLDRGAVVPAEGIGAAGGQVGGEEVAELLGASRRRTFLVPRRARPRPTPPFASLPPPQPRDPRSLRRDREARELRHLLPVRFSGRLRLLGPPRRVGVDRPRREVEVRRGSLGGVGRGEARRDQGAEEGGAALGRVPGEGGGEVEAAEAAAVGVRPLHGGVRGGGEGARGDGREGGGEEQGGAAGCGFGRHGGFMCGRRR